MVIGASLGAQRVTPGQSPSPFLRFPSPQLPDPSPPLTIASFPFLLIGAKAGSPQGAEGSQQPLVVGTGMRLTKGDGRKGSVRRKGSTLRIHHLVCSLTSARKINAEEFFFVMIEKFRF